MTARILVGDRDVSRETLDRLEIFLDLLRVWNPRINLVSRATLSEAWTRHVLDSAQIFELAPKSTRYWADFGSGGGFPGLVVGVLAAELAPQIKVTLVESDQRKAVFLRTAALKVGVDIRVVAERIETIAPLGMDVVSARALGPLTTLLGHASRHLVRGGTALFLKGASWRMEVAEALASWRFRCEEIPSRTAADAVVLRIGEIERV